MLLVIDAGNTNIVFGVYLDKKLIGDFRIKSDHYRSVDEYATILKSSLEYYKITLDMITGVILSSVVRGLNNKISMLVNKYLNSELMIVGPNLKSGIAIKIEQPKSLGSDLLVACVAASKKYGSGLLIIDLGTATSMSVLNHDNEFIGGSIHPGLETSLNALSSNAAALPDIDLVIPDNIINKDTISCMQSGIMYGYTFMIEGMIKAIINEYKASLKVIITGGYAPLLMPLLNKEMIYDANLVMDGLMILYYKNV